MNSEMKKELEKRVKHVVSLSKEIPWYVRKYKELGIDPDEIRKPEDLLKAYEKGLYTTPADLPELVYYKHPEAKGPFYTSGTTRKPKEIWLNPDDEKRITIQGIKIYSLIFKEDDKILNCFPELPAVSGYMSNLGLSVGGYNFKHFPAQKIRNNFKEFTQFFKEFDPTAIMGLTTFVYRLPFLLHSQNIFPKLRCALVSAEPSTIERRKFIGKEMNAKVYDLYCSSENGVIAFEDLPFRNEYKVCLPETLLFLVDKNNFPVDINETGDVVLTNLFDATSKPFFILLNYKIGDSAKCIEREKEIITFVNTIRRIGSIKLGAARIDPYEAETAIESLGKLKEKLTGEYFWTPSYEDSERREIRELRVESKMPLSESEKIQIEENIRKMLYSINYPLFSEVEKTDNAKLLISVVSLGELYKGYEEYIKPGKPIRYIR